MNEDDLLAARFEEHRPRLRAVAYRMLGSLAEADDAVQEGWLRLSRSGADVQNLAGWLTTVVARVCLDMLRSRRVRGEEPLEAHVPDMLISLDDGPGPEDEIDAISDADRLSRLDLAIPGDARPELGPGAGGQRAGEVG
jgi:RNA polymerase sigma-70 factor (ECF subfamily)